MKLSLFLLLVLVAAPHLTAQSTGIEQSSNLITVPAGDKFLRWHGHTGRSYFVQVSDANKPLGKWSWAPIIESGHNEEISYEVDGSSSRGFFRLLHTNLERPPGVSLEDWDPDGDRLRNRAELTIHGSNPLKSDTDDDGLPDDWEIAHGLNVLDNGTEDPDRGPDSPFGTQPSMPQGSSMMAAAATITNSQAFAAGVQAVTGATLADRDGDLLPDADDADPLSPAVSWRKAPKPGYVVIPVPGWAPAAHSFPRRMNNRNDILTSRAVFKDGQWFPINAHYLFEGQGPALSYRFMINGRLHPSHLGYCVIDSISDQGDIMGSGIIRIDPVTETNPATGEQITYSPDTGPSFALIWRNPAALPEIFGVAPGATLQGAFHSQSGMIHRDGTVLMSKRRPEDILANNNATLERHLNAAGGGGVQTSPTYLSPRYTYPAIGGSFAFRSYLSTGQGLVTQAWIWPAAGTPQSLYTAATPAPGAPALNFQTSPSTIGTAPGGEACINLSGQVLVGRSGRYHQVPGLQGATFISPHGAAIIPTPTGNPTVWYGGSTYPLSSCISNPQALGTTLTVSDLNDTGSMLAIVDANRATQKLVILLPVEVSWKAIAGFDNVDDHIDPWNQPIHGKRIFPDFKNPNESEIQHKVEVIVKTSSALVGKAVFVKGFDVDDSTSEGFDLDGNGAASVIDTNGKAGDDNLIDYLNNPKNGQFWTGSAWGGQTAQGTVDANGETKFIFRVGIQPGNNYRVVASVIDESMYAGVQTTDPTAAKYLGPEANQNGGAAVSPLLTVWRKLWVENDSMGAIPKDAFGYKRNDLSWDLNPSEILNTNLVAGGAATSFGIAQISDSSSFLDLENGTMIVQSTSHPVSATASYSVTIPGNHSGVPLRSGFRLYDDDDFGLAEEPLQSLNLVNEQMKDYFKPSFIEVKDAAAYNPRKTVPLRLNEDVSTNLYGVSNTVVANARDLTDNNLLWVCPVTVAYQGPQSEDRDPGNSGEGYLMGETASYGKYDHSTVFVETCRENYDTSLRNQSPEIASLQIPRLKKWIIAVTSHEMAHQPGNQVDDHYELGLMGEPMSASLTSPENAKFTATSVFRFRKSNRWSE